MRLDNFLTLSENLDWHSNWIAKQAYRQMDILRRLYDFQLPMEEMIGIYTLYVRSILESSAVV